MAPRDSKETSSGKISLRPASVDDDDFLLHVYANTRKDEMASWGWSTREQSSFIRMQYDARKHGYATSYPSAESAVISISEVPAGSMIVFRSPDEIRLVDIALLPEFRGRGLGGEVIRMLISEAARAGSRLRLSVLRSNRATHLYERLGFIPTGGDGMYCEMECRPTESRARVRNPEESVPNARKSE
jgi:ribosomal protein S18 acetylase RimI-like enzyme